MTSNIKASTCSVLSAAILEVLTASGCVRPPRPPGPDFPARYGLEVSPRFYPLIGSAIDLADRVLGAAGGARLRYGWTSADERGGSSQPADAIPVYVVGPYGLGSQEIAFVAPKCQAIIVQGRAFEEWLSHYQSEGSLEADPSVMVAFLLLHETGHIRNGDCDGYQFVAGGTTFTIDTNTEKHREIAADRFAAESVRRASAVSEWSIRGAALNVQMAVSTFSFLISGQRIVDHPGQSLLPTRDVFWDVGLSHPNLEWRLLSLNYQLNPTSTAKQFLDQFEASREKVTDVLYQKPE